MTAKAQLLAVLASGDWVPTRQLLELGGDPLRRLRELRADGVVIDKRTVLVDGHWRSEYRLPGGLQAPGQETLW